MEQIIKDIVEVGQDDWGDVPVYLTKKSRLGKELAWKYRKAHFFAFTDQAKELIALAVTILMVFLTFSFFTAHFLLYITGFYQANLPH
jgi:hypothetical protein